MIIGKIVNTFAMSKYFPHRKTSQAEKIDESDMLAKWQIGAVALAPLVVRSWTPMGSPKGPDARVTLALPNAERAFKFAMERCV